MAKFSFIVPEVDWQVAASSGTALVLAALCAVLMYRSKRHARRLNAYVDLIENLSEGIYRSSLDGRQLSANKALVNLNGFDNETEMLAAVTDIGQEWYVIPTRREEFRSLLARDGKVEDFVSEIYRYKTRERIWISESARLVFDKRTNEPLFYEGSVREITNTVGRLTAHAQLQRLTKQLPGCLFQVSSYQDGATEFHYLNQGSTLITGVPVDEMQANPTLFEQLVFDEDRVEYRAALQKSAETLQPCDHEFRLRARDGAEKWLHLLARPEPCAGGMTWHGYVADISLRKRQELEIEELAFYDSLTRLPNRRMFMREMKRAVESCASANMHGALLFIDLDNFKTLNDTQGHDVGDAYLKQVAERLRKSVGERDVVARLGGDEFVVIVERAGASAAEATRKAITTANAILYALREEFNLNELRYSGSASIGTVVFDGAERQAEELLRRADIAMYQAKGSGRNGVALFDIATMDRQSERYKLVTEFKVSLAASELELHFQPQLDHNRVVTGAEALIRWRHPEHGVIPGQVIAQLSEQFGMMADLSRFVLENGLRTLAKWQSRPQTAHLRLAINMPLQIVANPAFVVSIARQIDALSLDPRKLTLEITESVNTRDQMRVITQMQRIKQLGIRLSLDDFGTGYSSLTFLKSLPFDEIKIDGTFVGDIEKSDSDRALIKTILSMARNLGLISVAEHVENVRQEAYLRAFGCDVFQGFLYSKAVCADELLQSIISPETPATAAENRASA